MDLFDLNKWIVTQGIERNDPLFIEAIAIDSRRVVSQNTLFIAIKGNRFDGHTFIKQAHDRGAIAAVVSEDFDTTKAPSSMLLFKTKNTLLSLQEIATLYRKECTAKVVAIAGSYGKTMLKDLLIHIIKPTLSVIASPESFNSQLGVALSIFKIEKEHTIAFIEVAATKPYEMDRIGAMLTPDSVIFTNLEKKRLDASHEITFELLKILNYTKEWYLAPASPLLCSYNAIPGYFFDQKSPILPKVLPVKKNTLNSTSYAIYYPDSDPIIKNIATRDFFTKDLLQMALALTTLLQLKRDDILDALDSYTVEKMRVEAFRSDQNILYVNDTYAEDLLSCDTSLNQLMLFHNPKGQGRRFFIFEGLRSIYNEEDILDFLIETLLFHKIDTLFLCNMPRLKELIEKKEHTITIIACTTKEEAFIHIEKIASYEDVVLIKGKKKEPIETIYKKITRGPFNSSITINLASIKSNINTFQKLLPKNRIMVMLKAFAYGTDSYQMALFLKQCGIDIFGLSYLDEAVFLRKRGITEELFVLHNTEEEISKALLYDIQMAVSSLEMVEDIERHALLCGKEAKIHLHLDTGMCRFGCSSKDLLAIAKKIKESPMLILEGLMTHLTSSDIPEDDAFTKEQYDKLIEAKKILKQVGLTPKYIHAANSHGALRFSFPECNMVRIAISVYGFQSSCIPNTELRPALSLKARVLFITTTEKGTTVSYGRKFEVKRDNTKIAALAIGYSDGLHRKFSSNAQVVIQGKKAPIIGTICMDYMMVDVTDIDNVYIGDEALIFGEDCHGNYHDPEVFAQSGKSIVHELISCLGGRVKRIFIYDESLRPS